ncbi:hypothetical protein FACS1894186_1330 [Alphaproteobacteria bacterium]|nr:hypothetical protein FACS1894186_1330 [Alphaproteobacteria bacterium]
MLTHPDGRPMIEKSMEGLDPTAFDRIIVTIVKPHDDQYEARLFLSQVFGRRVEVCMLDDFTGSASETVALTLEKMAVAGSLVIKDSDNFVKVAVPKPHGNFIAGYSLAAHRDIQDVAGKSFLIVDDQGIVRDIVEKKVVSDTICLGVYAFADAAEFLAAYESLRATSSGAGGEITTLGAFSGTSGKFSGALEAASGEFAGRVLGGSGDFSGALTSDDLVHAKLVAVLDAPCEGGQIATDGEGTTLLCVKNKWAYGGEPCDFIDQLFTDNGTFIAPCEGNYEITAVGGGGGGGVGHTAGGGGGSSALYGPGITAIIGGGGAGGEGYDGGGGSSGEFSIKIATLTRKSAYTIIIGQGGLNPGAGGSGYTAGTAGSHYDSGNGGNYTNINKCTTYVGLGGYKCGTPHTGHDSNLLPGGDGYTILTSPYGAGGVGCFSCSGHSAGKPGAVYVKLMR